MYKVSSDHIDGKSLKPTQSSCTPSDQESFSEPYTQTRFLSYSALISLETFSSRRDSNRDPFQVYHVEMDQEIRVKAKTVTRLAEKHTSHI